MTTIDKISFNFSVQEEAFAHSLYVQWDEYCHRTITTVLDEFFCEVDNKDKWIEIDLLKLELGSIPEEEFYTLFPLRLREALERTFSTYIIDRVDNHKLADSRLENLLHYLKYGACRAEWSDGAFDLSDELAFIMQYTPSYINIIVQTCFQKTYMLGRLMRDVESRFLMKMIAHWNEDRQITTKERQQTLSQSVLKAPTNVVKLLEMISADTRLVGQLVIHMNDGLESNLSLSEMERSAIKLRLIEHVEENLRPTLIGELSDNILWIFITPMSPFERQRYLAALLEATPRVVVDFIHVANNIHLDTLAEILNSLTIKYIMLTECESHAEVGVPEYWHYFYCWLLEHYPFNGVFSFGDKAHFQKHLNVKLLSFIRKRAYATYLSKAELTIHFLREVFGDEYYIKILNVIYGQQSMAADGSPEYSGYFNMELYYMFVHLSLLERRVVAKEKETVALVNSDILGEVFNREKFTERGVEVQARQDDSVDVGFLNQEFVQLVDDDARERVVNTVSSIYVKDVSRLLSEKEIKEVGGYEKIEFLIKHHPQELLSSLKNMSDDSALDALIRITDSVMLQHWIDLIACHITSLSVAPFRQLMSWIVQHSVGRKSEAAFARALFLWVKRDRWRTETQNEIREFFFSQLYDENSGMYSLQAHDCESIGDVLSLQNRIFEEWNKDLLLDYLKNTSLDIGAKQYVLRKYIVFQPILLLQIVRRWMVDGVFAIEELQEWMEQKDWVQMIAGISLPNAELVRQIMWYLQINKLAMQSTIEIGLIRFILSTEVAKLSKMRINEVAKLFIRSLELEERVSTDAASGQVVALHDIVLKSVISDLNIEAVNQIDSPEESRELPQNLSVSNAGLALLAAWFPRLFDMLGLLNEYQKDFKDMESRIRAIFIIQRLVSKDDREYKESELNFNRILVGCPFSVPLPKCVELTEREIETVDGMLVGVKANWPKMQNTSIMGFQHSFIEREGVIVRQEEKWVLSVDSRPYDMLLDSLPWSYSMIRLRWLESPITVQWRSSEKQEF